MDAEGLLTELCRRYGVPRERGERLLPLVRWALQAPAEARDKILAVVEETLAEGDGGPERQQALAKEADEAVLRAVARVLHDWTPSTGILDLGT